MEADFELPECTFSQQFRLPPPPEARKEGEGGAPHITRTRILTSQSLALSTTSVQRSAKVLECGLVKFVPDLAYLAGTNFTKPRTKTKADLCTFLGNSHCCVFIQV